MTLAPWGKPKTTRPKKKAIDYVLLHGFTGGSITFAPLVQRFGTTTRYILPQLAGHGSDWQNQPRINSFEQQVALIVQQIQQRLQPPIHLVGYSMGARIGLAIMQTDPTLIQHAWLIGVHPGLCQDQERQQRQLEEQQWISTLQCHPYKQFISRWQQQGIFLQEQQAPLHCQQQRQQERMMHTSSGLAHALSVLALSRMPCWRDFLRQCPIPIELVAGTYDQKFIHEHRTIAQFNPNIRCHEILGAGHHVLLTHSTHLCRLMRLYDQRLRLSPLH